MKMSEKYPKYHKPVPEGVTELDVYAVCQMFPVDDPSGAINHARKKLLVPGVRTGGKSLLDDVREARDTLTRWLELQGDTGPAVEVVEDMQRGVLFTAIALDHARVPADKVGLVATAISNALASYHLLPGRNAK